MTNYIELEMLAHEAFEKHGIGNRDKALKLSFRTKTGKREYHALDSWYSPKLQKVVYQLCGERDQKINADAIVIVRIEP